MFDIVLHPQAMLALGGLILLGRGGAALQFLARGQLRGDRLGACRGDGQQRRGGGAGKDPKPCEKSAFQTPRRSGAPDRTGCLTGRDRKHRKTGDIDVPNRHRFPHLSREPDGPAPP